jgi:hypothetical protein
METITAIFAVIFGFVDVLFTGVFKWLDKPPTNGSALLLSFFVIWFLEKSLVKRIDGLRQLITWIEDKRTGKWP